MTVNQFLKTLDLPQQLRLDQEILLAHILHHPREHIFAHPEIKLSKTQVSKFRRLWKKRLKNYPLAYLTGQKEFFGLDFHVNNNVLIPRPETEFMVEEIIGYVEKSARGKSIIADIGTGSGCIAVVLKKKLPAAQVIGLDVSAAALKIARKNSQKNKTAVEFYRGDVAALAKKKILPDIIAANLPYLDKDKKRFFYHNCPALKYEPDSALFANKNGLGDYISLLEKLMVFRKLPTAIFLEIGSKQIKLARRIFLRICGDKYDLKVINYKGTALIRLIISYRIVSIKKKQARWLGH